MLHWFKFNAVGALGILVQLGTLSFLAAEMHVNYLPATAVSVEAAILHNFLWHERFTWKDRTQIDSRGSLARLLKFNLTTGVISIAGNVLLMRVFAGGIGLHYFVANLLTIASCSITNFFISDRIVFRSCITRNLENPKLEVKQVVRRQTPRALAAFGWPLRTLI
jgi:putative flippase GtrA